MIFQFDFLGESKEYLLVNDLFPPNHLGAILTYTIPVPLMLFWKNLHRWSEKRLNLLILLISSISLLGVYIFSIRYIDEVYINLEHSYNLYHFGRFSFSPERMVDGTVEFFYYLLLSPFAVTRSSLIIASVGFGYLIAWLHLLILWNLLNLQNLVAKLILLLGFTLFLSLIYSFSDGFGSGLVSLLLLLCIYYQLQGKPNRALNLAVIFPLIRPDAILYSFAVLFVDLVQRRKIKLLYWIAPIFTLLIYLSLVKLFYGHWIPTPVLFKSFKLSMLPMINYPLFWQRLKTWFNSVFGWIFTILFAVSYSLKLPPPIKMLRWYSFPLFVIFIFYQTTTTATVTHIVVNNNRYSVGFDLFAIIFSLMLVGCIVTHIPDKTEVFRAKKNLKYYAISFIYLLAVYLTFLSTAPQSVLVTRTDQLGVAAQVIEPIIPKDWSISTTELNTFGYMNDREIIDLWGYTNREIATSKICNLGKLRNNPDFFLSVKPDVFWWHGRLEYLEDIVYIPGNLEKTYNQLGDLIEVINQYDIFTLKVDDYIVHLFIRNDRTKDFLEILQQQGYALVNSREIDRENFKAIYATQELKQYFCG